MGHLVDNLLTNPTQSFLSLFPSNEEEDCGVPYDDFRVHVR